MPPPVPSLAEPASPFDARSFRNALGSFPTGVAVITTCGPAGDHVLFLGQVARFDHGRQEDSLVFYKGAYMKLTQSLRELAAKGQLHAAAAGLRERPTRGFRRDRRQHPADRRLC